MNRTFAIGDVHGCYATFKELLLGIIKITKGDTVYCLGDLIDRGPESKGVVDFILELRKEGYGIESLKGNHEQMMIESVEDEQKLELWKRNGGVATLKSFDVESYDNFPMVYKNFFNDMILYHIIDDFILVHAGLNMNRFDIFEDKKAMLWIKDFYIDKDKLHGKKLVHGHNPKSLDYILSQEESSVINIDGGCVYNYENKRGTLIALNLNDNKLIFQTNIE